MLCKNCGKEIFNDSLFCPNCGFKAEKESSPRSVKRCADCGKEFLEERFYCDACGGKLISNEASPDQRPLVQQPLPPSPNMVTSSSSPAPSHTIPARPNGYSPAPPYGPGSDGAKPFPPYPNPNSAPNTAKKKNKMFVPLIVFASAFVLTISICVILFFLGVFDDRSYDFAGSYGTGYGNPAGSTDADNTSTDNTNAGNTNNTNTDDTNTNDTNATETNTQAPEYDYRYSYSELPDVLSLDSDPRFVYSAYYSEEGVAVYTYLFYNDKAADSDFLRACDDYSILLQETNGFLYEKDFSEQQYADTGEMANYLTREDIGIAITASIEDSLRYAYISIFPLGDAEQVDTPGEDLSLPNYTTYLAGREMRSFGYEETVTMKNGLSFYLYDIVARYPGDGSMAVDVTMDLSSYYSDYYSDNGDFMVFPVDSEGNLLSDLIPISYITDESGNNVAMPFLVSSSSYEYYTFTYIVPANTMAFSIYATNVNNEDMSGPVYVMDVGFN